MTVPAVSASGDMIATLDDALPDLRRAIDRYVSYATKAGLSPEATAEALQWRPPELREDASWQDLMSAARQDENAARALFERMKDEARADLASGRRGALTIEGPNAAPADRARFVELLRSVRDGLAPTNGLEHRLCDQIAQALHMHEFWLERHVMYECIEAGRIDRDLEAHEGWQPPRLRDVEASDRAVALADRFQRAALRSLKAFRDQRRILGTVIVADGGQLNVANQQVITGGNGAGDEG